MSSGNLRRKAYNHIHAKILSGDLPNGHQVSELSLAREIGISRTPVREAVQQLQREGLVEQLPRLGTIVRTPERRDIVELYELREALEPFAVGLAARRAPRSEFPTLEKLCAEMDGIGEELRESGMTSLDPNRLERFLTADMAFHVMLLRASGNHRMMRIVADSRVLLRIFSARRQEHNLAVLRETYQFHSRVLDAIKIGDAAGGNLGDGRAHPDEQAGDHRGLRPRARRDRRPTVDRPAGAPGRRARQGHPRARGRGVA